ncbi:MAG: hypothetical protein JXR32_03990 [Anaerolineaceae bacterium]|nr:hypothetical protein [Anaerolineaceae bacterium]
MKKLAPVILITIFLLVCVTSIGFAQTYLFSVDSEDVVVAITDQGKMDVEITYVFTNSPSASPIDYVDVGLPNNNFSLSDVTASVDGKSIYDISYADTQYVQTGYGVTLGLGNNAILPGHSGRVTLLIPGISSIVFPADQDEIPDYASFEFSPNWFGSDYVQGTTDLTVTLILPPGVTPDEPRYFLPSGGWPGGTTPESGLTTSGQVYYRWNSSAANAYTKYEFGAAFPENYIPAAAIVTTPPITWGDILPWVCCLGLVGLTIAIIIIAARAAAKRKLQYLPPKISIEGNGIKRGLTAVEAAILMEQPMDKVLTMILFAAIKKGGAQVKTKEPLDIEILYPFPSTLHLYESEFLHAFKFKGAERQKALQEMMVSLIKTLSEKMKGFSRKETIAYYEKIIEQAWAQVTAAETPEVKSQKFEEVMDWTMADNDYDSRTRDVFGNGPVFLPNWWGRYDPVYRTPSTTTASLPKVGKTSSTSIPRPSVLDRPVSLPHLPGSDFAASMVKGVQGFSSNIIGGLAGFTSAITNKTNPVPKPAASSGSSWRSSGSGGGGHSCACACACAGCACACAGGGR